MTVLSVAGLTVAASTMLDAQTARAELDHAADDLTAALLPAGQPAPSGGPVDLPPGQLTTVDREVRLLRGGEPVAVVEAGGLAFRGRAGTVRLVAGASIRSVGGRATMTRPPRLLGGLTRDGPVVISVAAVNGSVHAAARDVAGIAVAGAHRERRIGGGAVRLAVETATPTPWRGHLADRAGVAVVAERDLDGDGIPSVVTTVEAESVRLLIHELEVRVRA
ncbi:MAG: hypothetical protein ABEJ08_01800 [Halobacteriaceae archaeon]